MLNDNNDKLQLYKALSDLAQTLRAADGRGFDSAGMSVNGTVSGVRKRCIIDETWVDAIESALPHVGKAIEQSRSLLKNDGEVVRIDRAKKATKDSLTHLAKHSGMIKRTTDDGALAPDEIYVTENTDDYAVYENRFLYLLLTFLQSFIALRRDKIINAISDRGVKLRFTKTGETVSRTVSYTLDLSDASHGEGGAADEGSLRTVERINTAARVTDAFLATPLMRRVSTAPRLTPPVVRTNIIRSNTHFSAAFELFSFVTSYTDPGFTVEEERVEAADIPGFAVERLSELAALQSFIAHQSAFDGWDGLKKAFDEQTRERELERLRRRASDLERIRLGYSGGEISQEEYIQSLEETNRELDSFARRFGPELDALKTGAESAGKRASRLEADNERLKSALEASEKRHAERLTERERELTAEKASALNALALQKDEELARVRRELEAERDLLSARLKAETAMGGGELPDVFTDREAFIRLEAERRALEDHYKKQWAYAKRYIRRRELKKRGE